MGELARETPERFVVIRCDCRVIATDWAKARCRYDGRKNIQPGCPARVLRVEVVSEAPPEATPDG